MPPKFGNYLFRNLKGQSETPPDSTNLEGAAELADQTILLRPEDFVESGSACDALDWSNLDPTEIRVQFRDTQGLMEGRVMIAAGALRHHYPKLVPAEVKDEVLFTLSLRTVVLQLQNCIRGDGNPAPVPQPDFDTPIAQVAREDEGFIKLERAAQSDPAPETANRPQPSEERTAFPLIREKPQSALPHPPTVQVNWPPATAPIQPVRPDPFKDLPKVGPLRHEPKAESNAPNPEIETKPELVRTIAPATKSEQANPPPDKPLRRAALERLQEIFLTDDFLDAQQVAKLLRGFPKVKGAVILSENGSLLGGDLPEGFHLEAAFAAPGLVQASREFAKAVNGSTLDAVTLLANIPISVFLKRRVCILIAHEGRGLLPGMRERVSEIANALDVLYDSGGE
jgi:hypothetical protein